MRRSLTVDIAHPRYWLAEEVTYATVGKWFGHTSRDLRLDIIFPDRPAAPRPGIVWLCGGGWGQVDKGAHVPYLADLARAGFVVASVDYRLTHEATFPAAVEDVLSAVRWLRAHAGRYGLDPARIGVMGESAGGYLAAMAAVTGGTGRFDAGDHLDQSSALQAACPWYAPIDLYGLATAAPPAADNAAGLFIGLATSADPDLARTVNPLTYVSAATPPFLLLHGTADTTVPFAQSELIYDALAAHGVTVDLIALEGAEHADEHFFQPPVWAAIEAFFRQTLG